MALAPEEFLTSIFDTFKEKLDTEYLRCMERHYEKITTELNPEEYTKDYGKIDKLYDNFPLSESKLIDINPSNFNVKFKNNWFIFGVNWIASKYSGPYSPIIQYFYRILIDNTGNLYIWFQQYGVSPPIIINDSTINKPLPNIFIRELKNILHNSFRSFCIESISYNPSSATEPIFKKEELEYLLNLFKILSEHYYQKFTQYKPLFRSGRLIEYDTILTEKESLKSELLELRESDTLKTSLISELETSKSELERSKLELEITNRALTDTKRTLELLIEDKMTHIQLIKEENEKLKKENEKLKIIISSLHSELSRKDTEYTENIKKSKIEIDSLLREKTLLTRENRVLNSEKETLETRNSELEGKNRELEILKTVLIEDKTKYNDEIKSIKDRHKYELHELYMKNKSQIEALTIENFSTIHGKSYKLLSEELETRNRELQIEIVSLRETNSIREEDPSATPKPRKIIESMPLKSDFWIGLQKAIIGPHKRPIKINDKPFKGSDFLVYTHDTEILVGRLVYDYWKEKLELIEM